MTTDQNREPPHDYLRRLPPEYYRGQAYVHWSMTIQDRKTGWLTPTFHCDFREILAHTMFRCGLCCPLYCCMTDHFHLLWMGISDGADQRAAAKYFRKHLNAALKASGACLQQQAYDHVLREDERQRVAFESAAEYIARNPERAGLVKEDCFRDYPFTGCVVPGFPELRPWQEDYWDRFWRIYAHLRDHGLMRVRGEDEGECASA